jgi:hypothetical protein
MNSRDEVIQINYHFHFNDNREENIVITLDKLNYIREKNKNIPDWVKLEYEQCKNCKITKKDNIYCPIALSLLSIIPHFNDLVSYQEVLVTVDTKERSYKKKTTVHEGLSSLLGILMVTSGCPNMNILRPMVRFHLPFASIEETIVRSVGSYLLIQYFHHKRGINPDIQLYGLVEAYKQVQLVNIGMTKRLVSVSEKDANVNAVVLLDVFAKELPETIMEQLKDIEYLYSDI